MNRDSSGFAAFVAVVPTLYLAWFLSWLGTIATTCTGSDPKTLETGILLSVLFYAAGIFCFFRSDLRAVGLLVALPLIVLLTEQAAWAAELFVDVNLSGRSACNVMMGEEFGEARGGWIEYVFAPYYFLVSVASLGTVLHSYGRHHRERREE